MHSAQQSFDFLIPEESKSARKQSYSVEQPITIPFLMPGIYKRADFNFSVVGNTSSNVFISTQNPKEQIVPFDEFHKTHANNRQASQTTAVRRQRPPQSREHKPPKKPLPAADSSDALSRMAKIVRSKVNDDCVVIDRKRNAVVRTEFGSKQKIIYRLYTPGKLGLQLERGGEHAKTTVPLAKLKGRQKKRVVVNDTAQNEAKTSNPITHSTEKVEMKPEAISTPILPQQSSMRTRSGRTIKPLKPDIIPAEPSLQPPPITNESLGDLLADLKDRDFTCKVANSNEAELKKNADLPEQQSTDAAASSAATKRRVPPEAICPTCKKIFLGRRLQRHFAQHPDHMVATTVASANQLLPPPPPTTNSSHEPTVGEDATLFRFLTQKLQRSHLNEDQRAELFLNEINDLVEQLQLRSSRLIRSTSGLHMVTAPTARVLGIPEGQYALDINAIEAPPPEPEAATSLINFSNSLPAPHVNTRSLDYTSVSIDDTLTDEAVQKLNLSAGGKLLPPSEESLLRAVDDFVVRDGIEKLSETNLLRPPAASTAPTKPTVVVPHIDHASDNAVEAVTMKETPTATTQQAPLLDLAVDFFQFNNK